MIVVEEALRKGELSCLTRSGSIHSRLSVSDCALERQ